MPVPRYRPSLQLDVAKPNVEGRIEQVDTQSAMPTGA